MSDHCWDWQSQAICKRFGQVGHQQGHGWGYEERETQNKEHKTNSYIQLGTEDEMVKEQKNGKPHPGPHQREKISKIEMSALFGRLLEKTNLKILDFLLM